MPFILSTRARRRRQKRDVLSLLIFVRIARVDKGQVFGNLNPFRALAKGLLVAIKALEALLVLAVQRRILLMAEGDAG